MADDWKPGDLALCVDAGWNAVLRKGAVYTVERIVIGNDPTCYDHGEVGLGLVGVVIHSASGCANTKRFRKIRPLKDEERDSFLADLKLPAPLVEA